MPRPPASTAANQEGAAGIETANCREIRDRGADRRPRFWASPEFLHQALTFSEHQLAGSPLGINTNIQYLPLNPKLFDSFQFSLKTQDLNGAVYQSA